jgi:hypothetical protein
VLLKTLDQAGGDGSDLLTQRLDQWHQRGDGHTVGVFDQRRRGQLGGAQRVADLSRAPVEVALPAAAGERRADLGTRQPSPQRGGGRDGQDRQGVGVVQVVERFQAPG